ncbi:hypothetical protein FHW36_103340 [Chitinophaga polysaccharea]|uniref:DUF5723 domain-containing protein n=2 Tax=Chitinophaga polysaccharea TaxID=1293035 RepID=A0A561PTW2_9BACT|nr:hypothetical protein FHW36_103340 [Chitinophaga polysaccharea]
MRKVCVCFRETYFLSPTMIEKLNRIFFRAAALLLLLPATTIAQTFPGYNNSTYAGVHGVLSNPASAAGYRYKWDVNIVGVDVNAGNTYASVPKSVLFHMPDTFRLGRDYFLDEGANRKQNGWEMAEVVLPSVLYKIDEKQSVSFVWRMRSSSNGGNVTTPIANFFGVNFPNPAFVDKSLSIPQVGVSSHIWHELGLSYARVIKETYSGRWKAGVTLKLLSGVAAGYAAVKNVDFQLNNTHDGTITSGTMYYGYNKELDDWQSPAQKNLHLFQNAGIGADIGVIYEYRPDNGGFGEYEGSDVDDYQFRIGVSITDIGRIKYNKGAINTDLSLVKDHVVPNDLQYKKNESLQQYARRLNNYFTPLPTDSTFNMTLPTALNLMGDYNIDGRFFVSAQAVIALTAGQRDITKTYALTQFNITPRYESYLFGAYLPFTINHNGQADVGAAIRIGPLVVGSGTIFTNLLEKHIDHGQAFVALRLNSSMFKRGDGNGGGIFQMRKRQVGCPVNNN